jgi:hypothetical protein
MQCERLLTEALYMNAITNPVAIRAFTPVKAMPRYRPPMTFSDWNLFCLPGTAVPLCFCLPCTSRGRLGFVPAEKYKGELEGKVFHGEPRRLNFSPVPVGDRTDEVSIHRDGQLCPGCPAANRGNGDESPPVGLPLRAGFCMNISTSRAPPWWEASFGMGGCRADMTEFS